jgi:hypothetical protein
MAIKAHKDKTTVPATPAKINLAPLPLRPDFPAVVPDWKFSTGTAEAMATGMACCVP